MNLASAPDPRRVPTIGVEEEYLLVDPSTGELVSNSEAQKYIIDSVNKVINPDVGFATPEFLRAQVEIGTGICRSIGELRECLVRLRYEVATAADKVDLGIIAASTHPTAVASDHHHTDAERYSTLAHDLQEVARRMLICGMHIHVGVQDPEHRIDLLGQIAYFLPHMLVLSTSSPFWEARDTGLKCYRLSVFDELPRTGLPERFDSWAAYERHLNALVEAEAIPDASKIWWDIRPHGEFPTLENRIPDICTRLDDGLAVATLFLCVLAYLQELRRSNQRWRSYANMLIDENRWRAQRYGGDEGLIDFGIGRNVPYKDLLDELLELVQPAAERFGCVEELLHTRTIVERGTSADFQLRIYNEAKEAGSSEAEAFKKVVDWLREATIADL